MMNEFCRQYKLSLNPGMFDADMTQYIDSMLEEASDAGVSDKDSLICFMYVNRFLDDLCREIFGICFDGQERQDIVRFIVKSNPQTLDDYRLAFLNYINQDSEYKKAYPNKSVNFLLDKYNLHFWHDIAKNVSQAVLAGEDRESALQRLSKAIKSNQERLNFLSWYSLKINDSNILGIHRTKGSSMKKSYKIASLFDEDQGNYFFNKSLIQNEIAPTAGSSPQFVDEQRAADMESMRSKMISRTFAIDKILEKYRNILNEEQLEAIEDALNGLRKKIRKLRMASSINDSIIKTANILSANGFNDGARVLRTAVAGAGKEIVKTAAELTEQDKATTEMILNKLEELSSMMRQRGLIREIASLDIELYNMNYSSYFTELGDAQNKLMEAFTYAANKLDDLIPKLRGEYYKQTRSVSVPDKIKPLAPIKPETLPISKVIEEEGPAAPAAKPEVAKKPSIK